MAGLQKFVPDGYNENRGASGYKWLRQHRERVDEYVKTNKRGIRSMAVCSSNASLLGAVRGDPMENILHFERVEVPGLQIYMVLNEEKEKYCMYVFINTQNDVREICKEIQFTYDRIWVHVTSFFILFHTHEAVVSGFEMTVRAYTYPPPWTQTTSITEVPGEYRAFLEGFERKTTYPVKYNVATEDDLAYANAIVSILNEDAGIVIRHIEAILRTDLQLGVVGAVSHQGEQDESKFAFSPFTFLKREGPIYAVEILSMIGAVSVYNPGIADEIIYSVGAIIVVMGHTWREEFDKIDAKDLSVGFGLLKEWNSPLAVFYSSADVFKSVMFDLSSTAMATASHISYVYWHAGIFSSAMVWETYGMLDQVYKVYRANKINVLDLFTGSQYERMYTWLNLVLVKKIVTASILFRKRGGILDMVKRALSNKKTYMAMAAGVMLYSGLSVHRNIQGQVSPGTIQPMLTAPGISMNATVDDLDLNLNQTSRANSSDTRLNQTKTGSKETTLAKITDTTVKNNADALFLSDAHISILYSALRVTGNCGIYTSLEDFKRFVFNVEAAEDAYARLFASIPSLLRIFFAKLVKTVFKLKGATLALSHLTMAVSGRSDFTQWLQGMEVGLDAWAGFLQSGFAVYVFALHEIPMLITAPAKGFSMESVMDLVRSMFDMTSLTASLGLYSSEYMNNANAITRVIDLVRYTTFSYHFDTNLLQCGPVLGRLFIVSFYAKEKFKDITERGIRDIVVSSSVYPLRSVYERTLWDSLVAHPEKNAAYISTMLGFTSIKKALISWEGLSLESVRADPQYIWLAEYLDTTEIANDVNTKEYRDATAIGEMLKEEFSRDVRMAIFKTILMKNPRDLPLMTRTRANRGASRALIKNHLWSTTVCSVSQDACEAFTTQAVDMMMNYQLNWFVNTVSNPIISAMGTVFGLHGQLLTAVSLVAVQAVVNSAANHNAMSGLIEQGTAVSRMADGLSPWAMWISTGYKETKPIRYMVMFNTKMTLAGQEKPVSVMYLPMGIITEVLKEFTNMGILSKKDMARAKRVLCKRIPDVCETLDDFMINGNLAVIADPGDGRSACPLKPILEDNINYKDGLKPSDTACLVFVPVKQTPIKIERYTTIDEMPKMPLNIVQSRSYAWYSYTFQFFKDDDTNRLMKVVHPSLMDAIMIMDAGARFVRDNTHRWRDILNDFNIIPTSYVPQSYIDLGLFWKERCVLVQRWLKDVVYAPIATERAITNILVAALNPEYDYETADRRCKEIFELVDADRSGDTFFSTKEILMTKPLQASRNKWRKNLAIHWANEQITSYAEMRANIKKLEALDAVGIDDRVFRFFSPNQVLDEKNKPFFKALTGNEELDSAEPFIKQYINSYESSDDVPEILKAAKYLTNHYKADIFFIPPSLMKTVSEYAYTFDSYSKPFESIKQLESIKWVIQYSSDPESVFTSKKDHSTSISAIAVARGKGVRVDKTIKERAMRGYLNTLYSPEEVYDKAVDHDLMVSFAMGGTLKHTSRNDLYPLFDALVVNNISGYGNLADSIKYLSTNKIQRVADSIKPDSDVKKLLKEEENRKDEIPMGTIEAIITKTGGDPQMDMVTLHEDALFPNTPFHRMAKWCASQPNRQDWFEAISKLYVKYSTRVGDFFTRFIGIITLPDLFQFVDFDGTSTLNYDSFVYETQQGIEHDFTIPASPWHGILPSVLSNETLYKNATDIHRRFDKVARRSELPLGDPGNPTPYTALTEALVVRYEDDITTPYRILYDISMIVTTPSNLDDIAMAVLQGNVTLANIPEFVKANTRAPRRRDTTDVNVALIYQIVDRYCDSYNVIDAKREEFINAIDENLIKKVFEVEELLSIIGNTHDPFTAFNTAVMEKCERTLGYISRDPIEYLKYAIMVNETEAVAKISVECHVSVETARALAERFAERPAEGLDSQILYGIPVPPGYHPSTRGFVETSFLGERKYPPPKIPSFASKAMKREIWRRPALVTSHFVNWLSINHNSAIETMWGDYTREYPGAYVAQLVSPGVTTSLNQTGTERVLNTVFAMYPSRENQTWAIQFMYKYGVDENTLDKMIERRPLVEENMATYREMTNRYAPIDETLEGVEEEPENNWFGALFAFLSIPFIVANMEAILMLPEEDQDEAMGNALMRFVGGDNHGVAGAPLRMIHQLNELMWGRPDIYSEMTHQAFVEWDVEGVEFLLQTKSKNVPELRDHIMHRFYEEIARDIEENCDEEEDRKKAEEIRTRHFKSRFINSNGVDDILSLEQISYLHNNMKTGGYQACANMYDVLDNAILEGVHDPYFTYRIVLTSDDVYTLEYSLLHFDDLNQT